MISYKLSMRSCRKIYFINIYGKFLGITLIILLFAVYCRKDQDTAEFSEDIVDVFPFEFPIQITDIKDPIVMSSEKAIFIISQNDVNEINFQDGLKKYRIEGQVKQVVEKYIVVDRENKAILLSSSGDRIDFNLGTKKYFFLSSTEVIFWKDGNFFLKQDTEKLLFKEESEPSEIFGIRRVDGQVMIFWNSKRENWFWDGIKRERLGRYKEIEELKFYLSGGSYVAISTKDVMGEKTEVELFYGEDRKKIQDFVVEKIPPNYLLIKVPPDKFPLNQRIYVGYTVDPQYQDGFYIFTMRDIYFLDLQLLSTEGGTKYCRSYIGKYSDGFFIRQKILPTNSCDFYADSNSEFLVISSYIENLLESRIFVFWGQMLLRSYSIDGRVYPVFIGNFPYIYIVNLFENLIYVEPEKISW